MISLIIIRRMTALRKLTTTALPNASYIVTRIGDIEVSVAPPFKEEMVPTGLVKELSPLSSEVVAHLEWMGKKYMIGSDMILLGHHSELRKNIALLFAEVCDIEVEYIRLSKDTTESDLKQRREISTTTTTTTTTTSKHNDKQTVIFHDQAPVRAAIHGRLLILDGLDQVERNVLPSLNNLLENREMNLDDGRRLGSPDLPVHPQFRVISICLQTPPYGPGFPLDPPLRSRFQSRFIDELDSSSMMVHLQPLIESQSHSLSSSSNNNDNNNNNSHLKTLLTLYETFRSIRTISVHEGINLSSVPIFGLRQIKYCLQGDKNNNNNNQFLQRVSACLPSLTWMKSSMHPRFHGTVESAWESVVNSSSQANSNSNNNNSSIAKLTASQSHLYNRLTDDLLSGRRHVAILGPKSSGKSFLVKSFLDSHSLRANVFPLYSELTSRDLLQRRVTDADGRTVWVDSVLVSAARQGLVCVLDGINRVDSHALVALQRLLLDGIVDLPNGERLKASESFRCISLGEKSSRPGDHKWVSIDLNMSIYELKAMEANDIMTCCSNNVKDTNIDVVVRTLYEELEGPEYRDVLPNLRHVIRLNRFFTNKSPTVLELKSYLEDLLLLHYQPATVKQAFETVFNKIISKHYSANNNKDNYSANIINTPTIIDNGKLLKIGDLEVSRRVPIDPSYVPNPLFYNNNNHDQLLKNLLQAYNNGEKSFLLIGNQGVGKNKIVDYFLHLLNAEREYIQLHRDSTVNSLTLIPTLTDGRIHYEDSVVIKAAKRGSFLIIDEVDKAPTEITFLLKHIVDDGELTLVDGRRLISRDKYLSEKRNHLSSEIDKNVIIIHPDFRMIVLANRPGFPFLGNNFYREIGGVFQNVIVNNLDSNSELILLKKYGPSVDINILRRLSSAFAILREQTEAGKLLYPFSVRENVAIVKHLNAYPQDGVVYAIESILAFENLSPSVREHIANIFQEVGIPVPNKNNSDSDHYSPRVMLSPSIPLPSPIITKLKLIDKNKFSDIAINTKRLKRTPWTSFQLSNSSTVFSSARINTFTEKYGTITLPKKINGTDESKIVSANFTNGNLHALSTNPLELHTVIGGGSNFCFSSSNLDAAGSKINPNNVNDKQCISLELLSTEMSYRLGNFNPLLIEATNGPIVLLPELSMSLCVSFEMNDNKTLTPLIELLTIPLPKEFFKISNNNSKGKKPKFFDSLFSVNKTNNSDLFCVATVKVGIDTAAKTKYLTFLWKNDLGELVIIDFVNNKMGYVTFPNEITIDKIISYSVDYQNNQISVLVTSQNSLLDLRVPIAFEEKDGVIKFSIVTDDNKFSKIIPLIKSDSSQDLITINKNVLFGGTSSSHALIYTTEENNKSVSVWKHWPRTTITDFRISQTVTQNSSNVYNLIENITNDNQLILEVVDPIANQKKSIDMTNKRIVSIVPEQKVISVAYENGTIDLFEFDNESLKQSQQSWQAMFKQHVSDKEANNLTISRLSGSRNSQQLTSIPRTDLGSPKHGKEDDKAHVGGNNWAGGTGGSDTAGLGGRGGPYRLDKGHPVHQVSDADKAKVSDESKIAAAKMAKEALQKRLQDIDMEEGQFEQYLDIKSKVQKEIIELSGILENFSRRSQERIWLTNKSDGELDDSKLVDGLTGENLIFKRRGDPDVFNNNFESIGNNNSKKFIHFCIDVSASMYRFDSSDGRLTRLLESVLLILESLGSNTDIRYAITGHSGDSPEIKLIDFDDQKPKNEMERYKILEKIVSYSQFSSSGDYTLLGAELAISRTLKYDNQSNDYDNKNKRYVIVISDANFDRYNIRKESIINIINKHKKEVVSNVILIASRDEEAQALVQACPNSVHMVLDATNIPKVFKKILSETLSE